MGVVDGDDTFVTARLVVAFGRSAQHRSSRLVGHLDLAPIEGRQQTPEGIGFLDRGLSVGRSQASL